MMTEDKARTKWCPHHRGNYGTNFEHDPVNKQYSHPGCIGPECMMWRWIAKGEGDCALKYLGEVYK